MATPGSSWTPLPRRISTGVALSVLVHGCVAVLLWRARPAPPRLEPARTFDHVEVEMIARPIEPPPPAPPAPTVAEPSPAPFRRAPPRSGGSKRRAPVDERSVTPGTAPAVVEDHPLMRMRDPGSVTLIPGQDTLARALGPVEAPAGPEKPARRKPRLPGTGLTCYRFAAKVWRTRPDLTNLSLPFKLNFKSSVRLVTYQKLGS